MYGKKDNMYDNLLSRKWKKRYEEQSAEVQKKLDEMNEMLDNIDVKECNENDQGGQEQNE